MSKRCLNLSALGAVVLSLLLVADAAPYQVLEPREGFVPVYIREGDTPLLEINPRLAEAFNEIDTRNLLEAAVDQNSEQKPDLILMSVDGGEPVLIAQSADQLMSENESEAEPMIIAEVPESQAQDESDDVDQVSDDEAPAPASELIQAAEEGEAPQAEESDTEKEEMEETKQVLKELVDVLAEKMEEQEQEQEQEQQQEQEQEKEQEPEQEQELQQVDAKIDEMSTDDHKAEDQATDVSSVDAFKTKEIDVKSLETEEIDVPEEQTPAVAVSTDE